MISLLLGIRLNGSGSRKSELSGPIVSSWKESVGNVGIAWHISMAQAPETTGVGLHGYCYSSIVPPYTY